VFYKIFIWLFYRKLLSIMKKNEVEPNTTSYLTAFRVWQTSICPLLTVVWELDPKIKVEAPAIN
jgi:hypothetical protein